MKEDSLDRIIRERLEVREIEPSNSAWERLSLKLDEQQKQQNSKRRYYGLYAAASIVLLIGIGFGYFKSESPLIEPLVLEGKGIASITAEHKISSEIVLPKLAEQKIENHIVFEQNSKKVLPKIGLDTEIKAPIEETVAIIENTVNKVEPQKNLRIQVNASDLLYAVTHTEDQVKQYYASQKIERASVLDTIRKELIKRNLKVNPETILVQVEQDILDDQFKGGFMQKLRLKITDIAIAIADRNK